MWHGAALKQGKAALRRTTPGARAWVRCVQRARHHPGGRSSAWVVHEPLRFERSIWTRDPRALPGDDERECPGDIAKRPAAAASSLASMDRWTARLPSQA